MESGSGKRALTYSAMVAAILFIAFGGFHVLYSAPVTEYIKEFVAGCIGALITIAATAALLKSQNDGEIVRQQIENMFQLKLEMYKEFIEHLNKIHHDGKLTPKEMDATIDWAIKLSLLASDSVINALNDYLYQIIAFGAFSYEDLNDESHTQWLRYVKLKDDKITETTDDLDIYFVSYGHLIYELRIDLLSREVADHDAHFDALERINQIRNLRGVESVRVTEENGIEYIYPGDEV